MMTAQPRDDRIPVRFAGSLDEAGPGEALLLEGEAAVNGAQAAVARFRSGAAIHPAFCACCTGRDPAAAALGGLFQARARGTVPWFDAVVAVVSDPAAVATAIQSDLVAASRFRVSPPPTCAASAARRSP